MGDSVLRWAFSHDELLIQLGSPLSTTAVLSKCLEQHPASVLSSLWWKLLTHTASPTCSLKLLTRSSEAAQALWALSASSWLPRHRQFSVFLQCLMGRDANMNRFWMTQLGKSISWCPQWRIHNASLMFCSFIPNRNVRAAFRNTNYRKRAHWATQGNAAFWGLISQS